MNILYTEYHYSLYFVGSMLFYYAYFVTNSLLTTFNRKYRHLSNEKQMYVVSNLLKSIFLCFSRFPIVIAAAIRTFGTLSSHSSASIGWK